MYCYIYLTIPIQVLSNTRYSLVQHSPMQHATCSLDIFLCLRLLLQNCFLYNFFTFDQVLFCFSFSGLPIKIDNPLCNRPINKSVAGARAVTEYAAHRNLNSPTMMKNFFNSLDTTSERTNDWRQQLATDWAQSRPLSLQMSSEGEGRGEGAGSELTY